MTADGNTAANGNITADGKGGALRSAARRLAGNAGESMAEALVAMMVVALALLAMASMLTASLTMIGNAEDAMQTYYAGRNGVESLENSAALTAEETEEISVTISFDGYEDDTAQIAVYRSGEGGVYAYRYSD